MSGGEGLQLLLYLAAVPLCAWPLGKYLAAVFRGDAGLAERLFGWLARSVYAVAGVRPHEEMGWRRYAASLLGLNALGFAFVYGVQRLQGVLPGNPQGFAAPSTDSAFNTAVSFVTNTNWQGYGGESTMSQLAQMLALGSQIFLSAATGMAVLAALARSFARRKSEGVGNAWADVVRGTTHVLLPMSFVFALVLVGQGVVQSFRPYAAATRVEPTKDGKGKPVAEQAIPLGPAASQPAIKQLGTNGGGYFNANSAHPFENPTPLSNFLQCLAILALPAGCAVAFGELVGDRRQGWALFAAMAMLFGLGLAPTLWAEFAGTPALDAAAGAAGANTEGKEVRFGTMNSGLWAAATTAASNGSVNSMHDSATHLLGGLFPLLLMLLGEVAFGGVGSGLYGLVAFALVAVFLSGLTIGRTPEYLGKKMEAFEIKMAALVGSAAAKQFGRRAAEVFQTTLPQARPAPNRRRSSKTCERKLFRKLRRCLFELEDLIDA